MKKRIMNKILGVFGFVLYFLCALNIGVYAEDNIEPELNYIYINESEQEVGSKQSIVVSWGDGTKEIQSIELFLKSEDEKLISLEPVLSDGKLFLYEEVFPQGIYYISHVKIISDMGEKVFTLEELGVNAFFGVGKEYTGSDKSEHIEMESIVTEPEATIAVIDEESIASAQTMVEEALTNASSQVPTAFYSKSRTVNNNVIVVLDPGHDSTWPGASGNGIKEEIVTLKIANYCKAELEKYDGITVYLTRTGATTPFFDAANAIDDIVKRVEWADEMNADAFISIHLNSYDNSTVKGAEVFCSEYNNSAQVIAQNIQEELISLGLYNRGVKTNDEYAVIRSAQKHGFPGLIIEHAFMTNAGDANTYLKTEAGIKKLGVADAKGIAQYYGLSKIGTVKDMPEGAYTFVDVLDADNVLNASVIADGDYYYIVDEVTGNYLKASEEGILLEEMLEVSEDFKWSFVLGGDGEYFLRSMNGYDSGNCYVTEDSGKLLVDQKPVLRQATFDDGAITVKWKAIQEAEGYYVYRKTEGESWSKIATVESSDIVEYVDNDIVSNTTYTYTVRAYYGKVKSGYYKEGTSVTTPNKLTTAIRIYGEDRYETSLIIADQLKETLGKEKFETIILASGKNFADALAGSYLANLKEAPILMVNVKDKTLVRSYINKNLIDGGMIYVLGGEQVVPENVIAGLEDKYTVKRLWGETRYETNLAILNEADVESQELIVCTGKNFADSLSASAAKKPIMLVGNNISDMQMNYLTAHSGMEYCIIGGESAVSTTVEDNLTLLGNVERLGGSTRYETSILVAERYFDDPEEAILAYALNFPDGLCGGMLASSKNDPLILVSSKNYVKAKAYAKEHGINKGIVLGGPKLISDSAVKNIFDVDEIENINVNSIRYSDYQTIENVNYRTGPGTSYDIAGTVGAGKVVKIEDGYSKSADGYTWYRVKIGTQEYYIVSKYLKKL